jgi:LacI family transcriptional regulator
MKDIAKKAGVSKATVSRVINNTKPVSKQVREKVERVVNEYNYKPSSVARSLARNETKVIGLIIPDISNAFYSVLVEGISHTAHSRGYNVFLCNTFRDHDLEIEFLNLLEEKEVDAIILTTFHTTKEQKEFIRKFHKPVVTVNREFIGENLPKVPNIDIDNFKAAYDAVGYLINTGHKKIGIIRAEQQDQTCIDRLNAYKQVLIDHDMPINEGYIVGYDFHFESGYEGMMEILENEEQPDAMFCISDELATGAIRAINDFGLRVPEDISVIGFDDIPLAKRFIPSISTVSQPIFEMGKAATDTIIKLITGEVKREQIEDIILDYQLITRESTMSRLKEKEEK